MNLGNLLIGKIIVNGDDIKYLINKGFTAAWLNTSGSDVIFSGIDKEVYSWLLKYHSQHQSVPSLDLFRRQYPEEVYPLKDKYSDSLEACQALAEEKIKSFLLSEAIGKMISLHDSGSVDEAIDLLSSEVAKIRSAFGSSSMADDLGDPSFDVEYFLDLKVERGIPLGFTYIDNKFFGFQPGQLITILGRQKAGKTTVSLNSALKAWELGYDVLFFSVEMDTEMLRERIYCLDAHVSPSRLRRRVLRDSDREKVRASAEKLQLEESVKFRISRKKSLITLEDVAAEIDLYSPHAVYVDGFNFMLDKRTNKMTDDWQANESVAAGLKSLALETGTAVIVATQVQEKQYHAKSGIESRTIMGGTGLLKASDLVIGLDKDKDSLEHTLSCVLSRYDQFENLIFKIDWDEMKFDVYDE